MPIAAEQMMCELEELQRVEQLRFEDSLELDRAEFNDKQQEGMENFQLEITEEKKVFAQNQEIQKNSFVAKMEQKEFEFIEKQEEETGDYCTGERQRLGEFREKQQRERERLQVTEGGGGPGRGGARQTVSSSVPSYPGMGSATPPSLLSNTSASPSPVPSLEFIPYTELVTSIPDTCPNIRSVKLP